MRFHKATSDAVIHRPVCRYRIGKQRGGRHASRVGYSTRGGLKMPKIGPVLRGSSASQATAVITNVRENVSGDGVAMPMAVEAQQ